MSDLRILPDLSASGMRLLLGKPDPLILEIGANDGSDTLAFLYMFPQALVRSFEPDPRAIATWRTRVTDPRAVLHEVAVGDTNEVAMFYPSAGTPPGQAGAVVPSWDKSGSLLPPDQHTKFTPWLKFDDPIFVLTHTLDRLLGDSRLSIDFAWVDVQGAEAKVLRGGQKSIERIKWWYCEVHDKPYYCNQATLAEIQDLLPGFVIHSQHMGENYLFRNTRFDGSAARMT